MTGVLIPDGPWQNAGRNIPTSLRRRNARCFRQSHALRYPVLKRSFHTRVLRRHCYVGAALFSIVAPLGCFQSPFLQPHPETPSDGRLQDPEVQRIEAWGNKTRECKRRAKRRKDTFLWSSPSDLSSDGSCYSPPPSRRSLPFSLIRPRSELLQSPPVGKSDTPTNAAYTDKIRELLTSGPRQLLHEELERGTAASSSKAPKHTSLSAENLSSRGESIVDLRSMKNSPPPSTTPKLEAVARKLSRLMLSERLQSLTEKMGTASASSRYEGPRSSTASVGTRSSPVESTVQLGATRKGVPPGVRGQIVTNVSQAASLAKKQPATEQRLPKSSNLGGNTGYCTVTSRGSTLSKLEVPSSTEHDGEGASRSLDLSQRCFGAGEEISSSTGSVGILDTETNALHTRSLTPNDLIPRKASILYTGYSGGALLGSPKKDRNEYLPPQLRIEPVDGRRTSSTAMQSHSMATVDKKPMSATGHGGQSYPVMSAKGSHWENMASQISQFKPYSTTMPELLAGSTGLTSIKGSTAGSSLSKDPLAHGPKYSKATSLTIENNPFKPVSNTSQGERPFIFTSHCPAGNWSGGVAIVNPDAYSRDAQLRPETFEGLNFSSMEKQAVKPGLLIFGGASRDSSSTYVPLSHMARSEEWPLPARTGFKSSTSENFYDYPQVFYEPDGDSSRWAPSSLQNASLGGQPEKQKKWTKALGSLSNAFRSIKTKEPKVNKSINSRQRMMSGNNSGTPDGRGGSNSSPSTVSSEYQTQRSANTSPVSSSQSSLSGRSPMQDPHSYSQSGSGRASVSPLGHQQRVNGASETQNKRPHGRRYPGVPSGFWPVL